MQPAELGFALASPLFLLEEGNRSISITGEFACATGTQIPEKAQWNQFRAFGSGAEEWLPLNVNIELPSDDENPARFKVKWSITQLPGEPPLVNYNEAVLSGDIATRYPVIKFSIDGNFPSYPSFKDIAFISADIEVSVKVEAQLHGVQKLELKNDYGTLFNDAALYPFGPSPSKGSALYIGSWEAFRKPLESLQILLHWADLPATTFINHYQNYPSEIARSINFNVAVQRWENGMWKTISTEPLFSFTDSNKRQLINSHTISVQMDMLPLLSQGTVLNAENYPKEGFLRLVLQQGFGHVEAPSAFAKMTATAAVNPPYTPHYSPFH